MKNNKKKLITLKDVTNVITEFTKKRVDAIPTDTPPKELAGMIDAILVEKKELLRKINKLPEAEKGWIPVEEGLPEERDSIFKKWKGTDKWNDAMFEKVSDEVIVTVEYENGERRTKTSHTIDGEWNTGQSILPFKVIAWMPLPAPYKAEGE